MQERLAAALKDPLTATPLHGWPGPRQLLQLRLFSCLFPTSDKRHPVTSPLALLMGKHLLQCQVSSCYTAAVGLLVAGMALQNAAAAASHGVGDAAPEVLQPLLVAAAALAGVQGLPPAAVVALDSLQQQMRDVTDRVVSVRLPLVQSHRVKLIAPKEYNPRYEADFSQHTDYDPDRQRAAARKLQRQVVKESRGAMRELRRDAVFMAAVQEADAKSGGQRGMNPHKKRRKP
eukprot:gene8705-8886_t